MEITIFGVLTGAVLPLFGYLAFHYLASARERNSRYATACNDFRKKITLATSAIPRAATYWDNNTLELLPEMIKNINIAIEVFKYFKSDTERKKIENDYIKLKDLVKTKIPEAISKENLLYKGGQHTPEEAKLLFWENIEELKHYANKT